MNHISDVIYKQLQGVAMLKKLVATSLSFIAITAYIPAHAESHTCSVEVAVSTAAVEARTNIAFNITNEAGVNRSITLSNTSNPQVIDNLLCSTSPYMITATAYLAPAAAHIGECRLKAGAIVLGDKYSSVSVVYPDDFRCNA